MGWARLGPAGLAVLDEIRALATGHRRSYVESRSSASFLRPLGIGDMNVQRDVGYSDSDMLGLALLVNSESIFLRTDDAFRIHVSIVQSKCRPRRGSCCYVYGVILHEPLPTRKVRLWLYISPAIYLHMTDCWSPPLGPPH